MDLEHIALTTIDGAQTTLAAYPGTRLVVNVASRCGFTPQYAGLQKLHDEYKAADSSSSASRATISAARSRVRRRRSPGSARRTTA